ncbi:MAG TPA: helicase-associated domain-containing protein [Thermomicrobiales bacterium]|nr:helicase-associated domain-containing protein [Thermomicrobiales bacterium]
MGYAERTDDAPAAPPLLVQHDGRLLLDATARAAPSVADGLRRFAELEKCAGDYHVYRLTRHSLWHAAAAGVTAARIAGFLARASGAPPPPGLARRIAATLDRYGRVSLVREGGALALRSADPALLAALAARLDLPAPGDGGAVALPEDARGAVKAGLARLGYPARDEAGYAAGAALAAAWRPGTALRDYQREALAAFVAGGSGLVLLPCGAGKTLVGVGATVALGCRTLVLCPHTTSARQWLDTYAAHTDLPPADLGEYGPRRRAVRPVTVTTYQMLAARRGRGGERAHLDLFGAHDWGLIVYDEAHLLPADVFRLTAALQSRRRLGLTATPVREDGREADLFALLGPVLYRARWGRLEEAGWIAPARCAEVRVPLAGGAPDLTHREAAASAAKWPVVRALLRRHAGEPALVIGHYVAQLRALADHLGAPLVSGATPAAERERLFAAFRAGDLPVLVLSRVGNAALDLPNAAVAVEVSGNFGSRQEEAQRLGRILRPKGGLPAHFYLVVADDPAERAHAARRQRYLVEQGYRYTIVDARAIGNDE